MVVLRRQGRLEAVRRTQAMRSAEDGSPLPLLLGGAVLQARGLQNDPWRLLPRRVGCAQESCQ